MGHKMSTRANGGSLSKLRTFPVCSRFLRWSLVPNLNQAKKFVRMYRFNCEEGGGTSKGGYTDDCDGKGDDGQSKPLMKVGKSHLKTRPHTQSSQVNLLREPLY